MRRKPPSQPHVRVVRRPAQSRLNRAVAWLQESWRRTLEVQTLWVVVYLVVGTWALMPRLIALGSAVSPHEIAQREDVAIEDLMVPDEATTAERQRAARDSVLPVYDRDVAFSRSLDRGLEALFQTGRDWLDLGLPDEEVEGSRSADLAPHLEELTQLI